MSADRFLTDREVRRLTGEREKGAQIAWLVRNGVRHWVNAQGKPIVAVATIEGRNGEGQGKPAWAPDFGALAH